MPSGTAAAPAPVPFTSTYIIRPILPAGVIHVVSGSSGSGKTQWILQLLADLAAGRDILGYPSTPTPAVYVSLKQFDHEIRTILARCDIAPSTLSYVCLPDHPDIPHTFAGVLSAAQHTDPSMRLLVLDGIDELINSSRPSDLKVTSDFLGEMRAAVRDHSLTIMTMGPTSKSKEGESYANARQRMFGSVAWGTGASTHINIESSTSDARDRSRRITLSCRATPTQIHDWRFDEYGILVPSLQDGTGSQLTDWARTQPPGEVFTKSHLIDVAAGLGVSEPSLKRWLTNGGMADGGWGKWKIKHTQ